MRGEKLHEGNDEFSGSDILARLARLVRLDILARQVRLDILARQVRLERLDLDFQCDSLLFGEKSCEALACQG